MILAVREKCIDLYFTAECALLPMCFAINHVNYVTDSATCYSLENLDAWSAQRWFWRLTIHGDLITEVTIN